MKSLPSYRWNEQTASHLLARAGFGGAPELRGEFHRLGLDGAVDRLVEFPVGEDDGAPPSWVRPGVEKQPDRAQRRKIGEEKRREKQQEFRRLNRSYLMELRAWWLYRMRYDPYPLREKMTLFLHGHFATGQKKVRPVYTLYKQNQMFRESAGGNWKDIVMNVARDPAMLIYLDNARSNKRKPNENFARELMELFTLGEGNYSEEDVMDVARAFTGWSMSRKEFAFQFRPRLHDDGQKEIFGKRGKFTGEDVIELIYKQQQSAHFLARKLTRFFVADAGDKRFESDLAQVIWNAKFEMKPILQTLFRSAAFYDPRFMNEQVKSPVQWLISMLNQLECPMPPPRKTIQGLRMLGQELFDPPNVKGWDGGVAWITAASLLHRYNLAGDLLHMRVSEKDLRIPKGEDRMGESMMSMEERLEDVSGELYGARQGKLVDVSRLLAKKDRKSDDRVKALLWDRFFPGAAGADGEKKLDVMLRTMPPVSKWKDDEVLALIHTLMSTPHYQLT